MFLSKQKKLLSTANFTKIQSIWLRGSFRVQKSSQKPFHQYLIGLKVEIWYYMMEISQNVNMLTSVFFENF